MESSLSLESFLHPVALHFEDKCHLDPAGLVCFLVETPTCFLKDSDSARLINNLLVFKLLAYRHY